MRKAIGKVKQTLSILLAAAIVATCIPQTALSVQAAQDDALTETEIVTESDDASIETEAVIESDDASVDTEADTPDAADDEQTDSTPGEAEEKATETETEEQPPEAAAPETDASDAQETEPKEEEAVGPALLQGAAAEEGDIDAVETAKEINVTVADYEGNVADTYDVYLATVENGVWTKGEKITAGMKSTEGSDVCFIVVPIDQYKVISWQITSGDRSCIEFSGRVMVDGRRAYGCKLTGSKMTDDVVFTIKTAIDQSKAYQVICKTANGADLNYTISVDDAYAYIDDRYAFEDGSRVFWTVKEQVVFTVTPDDGYYVKSVEYDLGGGSILLTPTGNDREIQFEHTCNDWHTKKLRITVEAIPLVDDGKRVIFDNQSADYTYTVTSEAWEVAPIENEVDQYQLKSDAQYVKFKLWTRNTKIAPKVMVGEKDWWYTPPALSGPRFYTYQVSASLFDSDNITITIKQEPLKRRLTVIYDEEYIEDIVLKSEDGAIAASLNDARKSYYVYDEHSEGYDEEGMGVEIVRREATWTMDIDSVFTMEIQARENCQITTYQVGSASKVTVNGVKASRRVTFARDYTIDINSKSLIAAKLYKGQDNTAEAAPASISGMTYTYHNIDYNQTYYAEVIIGGTDGGRIGLASPTITGTAAGSASGVTVNSAAKEAVIFIGPEDFGKTLTIKLYEAGTNRLLATYILKAKDAAAGADIAGVKSGKLTQPVDTEATYTITTKPQGFNSSLALEVADNAAFTAVLSENKQNLTITTKPAKDADAVRVLKDAAAEALIKLVDTSRNDAVVTSFTLEITEPAALQNATPTVALKFAADNALTLTLGVPAAAKVTGPEKGSLWYAVTITPKGEPAEADKIKPAATYYVGKDNGRLTQDITIPVIDKECGSGKAWSFDVTAQVVQTLNDCNLADSTVADADKAAALTDFKSKLSKTLAAATKNPYYETKLSLAKGVTTVYTGQKDVKIATVKFTKPTTHTEELDAFVVNETDNGKIAFAIEGNDIKLSVPKENSKDYIEVPLGKHTIRVTSKAPDNTYAASADIVVTINRGIEQLALTVPSQEIYKPVNAAAVFKATPIYNDNAGKGAPNEAKTKKVKDFCLVAVDADGNVKQEDGRDVIADFGGMVTVKNGTVTVNKNYAVKETVNENRFKIRVTAADYKDSEVFGYSEVITITNQCLEPGQALLVRSNAQGCYVPIIDGNGQSVTSGEFRNDEGEIDAQVRVLKSGVPVKTVKDDTVPVYTDSDFIDAPLTYKSSDPALKLDSNGKVTAVSKAANNITITVSTNDGGKKTAKLEKLAIINAIPTELGLKVEYRDTDYNYQELTSDYRNSNSEFTGTTDSVLRFTVMRYEDGSWSELDELSDVKVTIGHAKILNKNSAYHQEYTIIANKAEATVKLQYTDPAYGTTKKKAEKTFKITNNGFSAAYLALKASASGKLTACEYADEQVITYTLELPANYTPDENPVVMLQTDAADRSNVKNADRYAEFEKQGNVGGWMPIAPITTTNGKTVKTTCTVDLRFNKAKEGESSKTFIPAGNYKLQFTCGTLDSDNKFVPQTKSLTVTLNAVAPKSVKGAYKPVTTVKMSVYDTAAGRILAGTGKEYKDEQYSDLLNANITGQTNHFRELFELDETKNMLKLKSSFSSDLKNSLGVETDAEVIAYITESTSKEAKNDRIGYVAYDAEMRNGYPYEYKHVEGITKITVTFDNKKPTDTYALTSTAIRQDTSKAAVNVLMNKKAGVADIADAYVTKCDKPGAEFSVDTLTQDSITLNVGGTAITTPGSYKVTLRIIPRNNFYAEDIAKKKDAYLAASEADKEDKEKAYVDAITAHGIELTTTIKVEAKPATGR